MKEITWEDFEKVGQVRIDQVKMFINEKPFVSPQMDSSVIGEFRPRWISQPHFLEMLVEKASAFTNFELLGINCFIKFFERILGILGVKFGHF